MVYKKKPFIKEIRNYCTDMLMLIFLLCIYQRFSSLFCICGYHWCPPNETLTCTDKIREL